MEKKQQAPTCPRVDIGGQAVMEGVMMKGPEAIAVSVRRPNGKIVIKRTPSVPLSKKHPWMGWPFIRGAVSMCVMLAMGMRTLQDSTDMLGTLDEEPTRFEKWLAKKLGKGIDKIVMGVAIVLAVCLSLGLFVLLPNVAVMLFPDSPTGGMLLLKNLVSGLIRTVLLIGYMIFCGKVPDVRRTFQYHGAEHKTVYCHEHDLPLTPENARPFTTLHPRCGTSFLLLTFILSILFYSIFDVLVLELTGYDLGANYAVRILSRLLLLPCITGISYEALKALAHADGKLVRALRWPGMQLQRLTTRQPDDQMLEVAICSMNVALHGMPKHVKPDQNGWVYVDSYQETEPGYMPPAPQATGETQV